MKCAHCLDELNDCAAGELPAMPLNRSDYDQAARYLRYASTLLIRIGPYQF